MAKRLLGKLLFFVCLIAIPVQSPAVDDYPRNPAIDIVHYTFTLSISDSANFISGKTEISVKFLKNNVQSFIIDLAGDNVHFLSGMIVTSVLLQNDSLEYKHENDKLIIPTGPSVKTGDIRTYSVTYEGSPDDGLIISENKYGDRTFFADNWPDRCHQWLPVLDHPSDKATCEFVILAPEQYKVIANGKLAEESSLPGGVKRTHWIESVPIPAYCMVFGAARFAVQYLDDARGIPLQTWVFPQDRTDGFFDFARSGRALLYFIDLIGPYQYEKLANVQSKTRYGGMENASAVFYYQDAVNGKRSIENTVVHETAHMWFGDCVTEGDWHHIWLSEGFATYFTHVFNEFTFGKEALKTGLRADRKRIIQAYHRQPDSPVIDPNITNLMELLSVNSYQKGSFILHMLRSELGDSVFFSGIRAYFSTYKNKTALTRDFKSIMEKSSGKDLGTFFKQWLTVPGQPAIACWWKLDSSGKELAVSIEQKQNSGYMFEFPLDIALQLTDAGKPEIHTVFINKRQNTFTFPVKNEPVKVRLDPEVRLLYEDVTTH